MAHMFTAFSIHSCPLIITERYYMPTCIINNVHSVFVHKIDIKTLCHSVTLVCIDPAKLLPQLLLMFCWISRHVL